MKFIKLVILSAVISLIFAKADPNDNPLFSNNSVYNFHTSKDLSLGDKLSDEIVKEMNVYVNRLLNKYINYSVKHPKYIKKLRVATKKYADKIIQNIVSSQKLEKSISGKLRSRNKIKKNIRVELLKIIENARKNVIDNLKEKLEISLALRNLGDKLANKLKSKQNVRNKHEKLEKNKSITQNVAKEKNNKSSITDKIKESSANAKNLQKKIENTEKLVQDFEKSLISKRDKKKAAVAHKVIDEIKHISKKSMENPKVAKKIEKLILKVKEVIKDHVPGESSKVKQPNLENLSILHKVE